MEEKRKEELIKEFAALRGQNQDELSIIKALASKYSITQQELGQIMQENDKGRPGGESQTPERGQMGEAPPKGTIQGSDAPKGQK